MWITCLECGRSYNDEHQWTICPHSPLGHAVDDLCPTCDTLRSVHGACKHQVAQDVLSRPSAKPAPPVPLTYEEQLKDLERRVAVVEEEFMNHLGENPPLSVQSPTWQTVMRFMAELCTSRPTWEFTFRQHFSPEYTGIYIKVSPGNLGISRAVRKGSRENVGLVLSSMVRDLDDEITRSGVICTTCEGVYNKVTQSQTCPHQNKTKLSVDHEKVREYMELRIEQVESFGKHCLEIWIPGESRWATVCTGHAQELDNLKELWEKSCELEVAKAVATNGKFWRDQLNASVESHKKIIIIQSDYVHFAKFKIYLAWAVVACLLLRMLLT